MSASTVRCRSPCDRVARETPDGPVFRRAAITLLYTFTYSAAERSQEKSFFMPLICKRLQLRGCW